MNLFEEEYKLLLAFYLFDKRHNNDNAKINLFAANLYKVTYIKRSVEQIRYYLSCYKNVDTNYNYRYDAKNEKFRQYFEIYDNEFKKQELKTYYSKFKSGLLFDNDNERVKIQNKYIGDVPEAKKSLVSSTKVEYPRDEQKKVNTLFLANFKCEVDENHNLFLTDEDTPYLECHHLIPLMYHDLFDSSLDVESNLICLCPNCHKKLHYGKDIEVELKILYAKRKNRLVNSGIEIKYEELKSLYERRKKYDN